MPGQAPTESLAVDSKDPADLVNTVSRGASVHTAVWWAAVLGFPATLSSPGGTVSMALVAIYGLLLILREQSAPEDIRLALRYMLGCYLLVVLVDVLNGGGLSSLVPVGGYLPLIALAPYAYALRRLEIAPQTFDRAMQATVIIAVVVSVFRVAVLGEVRPGGFQLASVGYGVIVAIWATFLFSRSFEMKRGAGWSFFVAAAAFLPVLLSGSKIAIICIVVGFACVALLWAVEHRRWRTLLAGGVAASLAFTGAFYLTAFYRLQALWNELFHFYQTGLLINESFGHRLESFRAGWLAFLEKPILGHGLAEQVTVVQGYGRPGGPDLTTAPYIHNEYVAHMVSLGVFGLVFLALFLFLIWRLVSGSGEAGYRRAGFALLPMLIVYMTADVVFNMDPMSGVMTIAFGVVLAFSGVGSAKASGHSVALKNKSTKSA